jgi:hypothetical protein
MVLSKPYHHTFAIWSLMETDYTQKLLDQTAWLFSYLSCLFSISFLLRFCAEYSQIGFVPLHVFVRSLSISSVHKCHLAL